MTSRPYIKLPRVDAQVRPWAMVDLFAAYDFPKNLPGGGVVGIISFGGSYDSQDILQFCALSHLPVPDIEILGPTFPPDPQGANLENTLDIEAVAAAYGIATGGKPVKIKMIYAPDFVPGIAAAIKADCTSVSISWGTAEANLSKEAILAIEAKAIAATGQGVTLIGCAGDNGAGDNDNDGHPNVDIPGSCPHFLCMGGTQKPHAGFEKVWDDTPGQLNGEATGGGFSAIFPAQAWQIDAPPVPISLGRMVPDMAWNADPETGVLIFVNGQEMVIGGTSFCAPAVNGLLAAIGKRLGWINPHIWSSANAGDFVRIIHGGNGYYWAGPGPNPCAGVGRPIVAKLAQSLIRSEE